jgi:CheY-like chemotaxis protein
VANTADALAKLGEENFALLVLDVTLPTGDLERVIEHVAEKPIGARPIVLILAANPDATRSLDVEIVQIVLRKPVNLPQLVDVIRSCTRGTRLRTMGDEPRNRDLTAR